jgi:hypothetical protein
MLNARNLTPSFADNRRAARRRWPQLSESALKTLQEITTAYSFRIGAGDLLFLDSGWYVTHTGLLGLATRRGCAGIEVRLVPEFCDPKNNRWVAMATVFPSKNGRGFSGLGDADPANVGEAVRGAELRIAETRAVNRALRKAYGIGLCSVEELGSTPAPPANGKLQRTMRRSERNLELLSNPPLRDQLRQIIRQHQLDPTLTKSYALAHLEVKTMREATREQITELVSHLRQRLFEDREGFLAELTSRTKPEPQEVA